MRKILLQCKFLLVEWLNVTYQLVPNPLRNDYLRLFGIRLGGTSIHRRCKFFHVGKLTIGKTMLLISAAILTIAVVLLSAIMRG